MKNIPCEDLLDISIRIGSMMLSNGGETYRTEETITYTAQSLGAKTVSSFVTPTVIILSYTDEYDHYHTAVKRIMKTTVNLQKVARVNDLARRLGKRGKQTNPKQIENMLDRIEKAPSIPEYLIVLGAAISSFCFAFMFEGGIKEAIASFVIGLLLRLGLIFLNKFPINNFISSLISGGFVSIFSELITVVAFTTSPVVVTISVLMQVVPGLAIVNGIRDIISGDLVSGTARIVDAFMIAAGLSIGSVLGMLLI